MKKFYAIVHARTMEFVRDRGTLFWNLLFPLLLIVGFSFAFGGDDDALFKAAVIGDVPENASAFFDLSSVDKIVSTDTPEDAVSKVRQHQLDMLVDFNEGVFYLNPEASSAEVLRYFAVDMLPGLSEREAAGEPVRYIDWAVPGIIGMNMLFSCMFGVGFVIVRYRKNGVLKRMKATPITPFVFVTAQMGSRFVIALVSSVVIFTGTNLFLHFTMNGSWLLLLLITALAILCMISFGLIFAARIKSEELANGLMNIFSFPMMVFSGVFFSLEGSPELLQKFSKIFPLTHFVDGAREIMIDGSGLIDVLPQFAVLGAMTAAFLLAASLLFRWE